MSGLFLDGENVHKALPAEFTHDDLAEAGLTDGDAEQVLAFREFLRVAKRAPDLDGNEKVYVPEPWYSYALGSITAAEALEAQSGKPDMRAKGEA